LWLVRTGVYGSMARVVNESDSEEEVVVESGEEAGKGNNIIDELLE